MAMDKKKIFLLLGIFAVVIFLVGAVYSANDKLKDTSTKWDNKAEFKKEVNQKYGKYEIFDSILLGIGKGKKLIDIELKENTETCTQNCYAIKDITLYEEGSLVDDVQFRTLQQDGSWLEQPIRKYQFYIKQPVTEVIVTDYEMVCTLTPYYIEETGETVNIESDCNKVSVGTHTELTPEWIPYEFGDLLPSGTYTLKLEGEKRPTRIVDWVIQSQGIWTTEWATWGNISLGDDAEVILNSPADNSINYDGLVTFNATGNVSNIVGAKIVNMSLFTNETGSWARRNSTNYTTPFYIIYNDTTEYRSDLNAPVTYNNPDGFIYNITCQLKGNSGDRSSSFKFNYEGGSSYTTPEQDAGYIVFVPRTFTNPNSSLIVTSFVWDAEDISYVKDVLAYGYDYGKNFTYTFNNTYPKNQNILWNIEVCDTDNVCGFAPSNYTIFTDSTPPTISLTSPAEKFNFGKTGNPLYLNWSVSDLGGVNSCWYEYNGVNTSVNCLDNTTTFQITSPKSLKFWANDTLGNTNYAETNWSYYVWENSQTYNSEALETSSQTFTTNITLDNTTIQSAYLVYNNTKYSASIGLQGNQAVLSRTITVPEVSVTTNFSFFWEINLNSPQVNTTLQNQTVVAFSIDDCSVNSILVVNNTLVDEETQTLITGNSTIEVEVTLRNSAGVVMGTLSNIYYNTSYAPVCVNALYNTTIYVDIVTSYIAEDYVQEFWYLDNGLLNESNWYLDSFTTKNVTLRDLKLDDSQTFLFKYYNANFLISEGAIVQVLRNYIGEGEFKEVERCKLDANGECHLHLVEEDVIYEFRIIVDGEEDFLSGDYNAKCVATPCSITLQKGITTDEWDIEYDNLAEGTYTLTTNETSRIVSLAFNLEETGEMQLDVFTYSNDPNTQDVLVATDTIIAKSGTAQVTVPLSYGNTTYYAVVRHNDGFVTTQWVDLSESGFKYFGALGLFLGALLVLTLGLIAVSSGGWTIIFVIFGLIIASITKLIDMDYYLLMFVICAGGLIIWRLASRRSL